MKLSELLQQICASTPLSIEVSDERDIDIESPNDLFSVEVHHAIGDAVADACRKAGLTERGAVGFGEFIAELCTGWATRYSNESDVLALNASFGQSAFGNPIEVVRLYLLPNWDALSEHIDAVQKGVAAAFEDAKLL